MTLAVLRDDALRVTRDSSTLRLSLPWIRSLPLASLVDLAVSVDGGAATTRVVLGARELPPGELGAEPGWWFVQDRLVLALEGAREPGAHEVAVSFGLVVPYLQSAPDAPLRLPFQAVRMLRTDAPDHESVSRDVA